MSVKIISYSQSPSGQNLLEQIAFCARVSNPANQHNNETSEKLVSYLIRNNHWSPLEMVSVCLEIKTTRDIARQILRHRSFSFQEFSQRYADPTNMDFKVREARLQDHKNRQSSIDTEDDELEKAWESLQADVTDMAKLAYKWAITQGVAKEQARVVLPEGCTPSVMYMNGTLRSWYHYCQLRSGNGTQKEHRQIVLDAASAIETICPGFQERVLND